MIINTIKIGFEVQELACNFGDLPDHIVGKMSPSDICQLVKCIYYPFILSHTAEDELSNKKAHISSSFSC